MAGGILLGIDLGTTTLKLCAFDARTGVLAGRQSERLPVHVLPDGGREQDVAEVEAAFGRVIKRLRREVGKRWHETAGIGLAAQGGSAIVTDRASGEALSPMFLWNDSRSHRDTAELAAENPPDFWRAHTLRDVPPHGLGRMRWLKRERPKLFRGDTLYIGAGEYVFHRLTGVWRQDPGNALQMGSYDAVHHELTPHLLALAGAGVDHVAPLRQGHETAPLSAAGARVLGLEPGVPVAGPYIDQEAGYLSAAGASKRPLQCSLGTAWVGNYVVGKTVDPGSRLQLVLPSPVSDGRLIVEPLTTGNTAWDWALAAFIDAAPDKALAAAQAVFEERLLPPGGLVALPHLVQRNPIDPEADGGGVFLGVSTDTTEADLLRAVAAGLVFELGRTFRAPVSAGAVDSVLLGGGASKGPHFRDLVAAMLAPVPVYWQTGEDVAAARGCVYAFSARATRSRIRKVRKPRKKTIEAVREGFARYLEAYQLLLGPAENGPVIA